MDPFSFSCQCKEQSHPTQNVCVRAQGTEDLPASMTSFNHTSAFRDVGFRLGTGGGGGGGLWGACQASQAGDAFAERATDLIG